MMQALGLDVHIALANDPFFGRTGRMLAANQREQELKYELVVPITSSEHPTAVLSFNYHQELFGRLYGIRRRRRDRAHRLRRLRHGARRARAAQDARPRSRALAGDGAGDALAVSTPASCSSTPRRYRRTRAARRRARLARDQLLRRSVDRGAARASGSIRTRCSASRSRLDFEGDQWLFFKQPTARPATSSTASTCRS